MGSLSIQKHDTIIYKWSNTISVEVTSAFFMPKNQQNGLQKAIGASYSVLGSLALFGIGGYLLDRQAGSERFWIIIGLLLGVVIGLYELSKYILKK